MLHGFPYDAGSWKEIIDLLVNKNYRVFASYHRGYGKTRFLLDGTRRNAQYTALVADAIAFCDAMQMSNFFVIGHDWGATTACKLAALYPSRVTGVVALATAYFGNEVQEPSMQQLQAYWYQWFFNTRQGYQHLEQNRKDYCRYLWELWSPGWKYSEEIFERTSSSWDNPDFVDIVIHSYRHRWNNADSDPAYDDLEKKLLDNPQVTVPTIFLQGGQDAVSLPGASLYKEKFFSGYYERRVLEGTAHSIPMEAPLDVVGALEDLRSLRQK